MRLLGLWSGAESPDNNPIITLQTPDTLSRTDVILYLKRTFDTPHSLFGLLLRTESRKTDETGTMRTKTDARSANDLAGLQKLVEE